MKTLEQYIMSTNYIILTDFCHKVGIEFPKEPQQLKEIIGRMQATGYLTQKETEYFYEHVEDLIIINTNN